MPPCRDSPGCRRPMRPDLAAILMITNVPSLSRPGSALTAGHRSELAVLGLKTAVEGPEEAPGWRSSLGISPGRSNLWSDTGS